MTRPTPPPPLKIFEPEPRQQGLFANDAGAPELPAVQRVIDGHTLQLLRKLARNVGLRFGLVRGDFEEITRELIDALDAARGECDVLVAIVHADHESHAHRLPPRAANYDAERRAHEMAGLRSITFAHVPKYATHCVEQLQADLVFDENPHGRNRGLLTRGHDVRPLFPHHHANRHRKPA